MTVLDDPNPNPRGKWGWWGDPNVTDEMIVDYEMRNKRLNLPGVFGGMGPRIDEQYGYIPGFDPRNTDPFGGFIPLAGRYADIAQAQPKLTPVQAAYKNFGKIPFIGNLLGIIKDYEDKANYRGVDPELRGMLGLPEE